MEYRTMFICFALLVSCNDRTPTELSSKNEENCTGYYSNLNICNWNNEHLSIDSLLMDARVPLLTDTSTLFSLIGNPQKIVPIIINRNNSLLLKKRKVLMGNYLIYGNTIFEQYGEDVIVNTIDFESTNFELASSKITLKSGVAAKEIQKIFPESGKLIGWAGGNGWSGKIVVSTSKPHGGINEAWWFFIFQGGELKRLVLFSTPFLEEIIP